MADLTRFQCQHCLHVLGLPVNLVGRKIRCPMCGEPLTIPKADPKRTFKKQKLSVAIDKFDISDWDRAIAHKVLERGEVKGKVLYKAIVTTIKSAGARSRARRRNGSSAPTALPTSPPRPGAANSAARPWAMSPSPSAPTASMNKPPP